jgi:hypothetical protein
MDEATQAAEAVTSNISMQCGCGLPDLYKNLQAAPQCLMPHYTKIRAVRRPLTLSFARE